MNDRSLSENVRPYTRGLGVLAGLATFAAVGVADGVVALSRAPAGALDPALYPALVLHCVAVLLTVGLAWGTLGEALVAAGRRVELLRRFGRWVTDGPRRWFARDPAAAHGVLSAVIALGLVVGPVFPASYFIITSFHSRPLAALAIMLVVLATLPLAGVVLVLLAPALGWALRRLGRLASPGTIAVAALVALVGQGARFVGLNWTWLRNLDWGGGAVALVMLVGNMVALGSLGALARRRGRALSWRVLAGATAVALVAFVASALTFGSRQTVAATIFNRSVLTAYLARGLQGAIDLDRDGYSGLFNGGDCDDRNARVFPGAVDIPGNGVDENCTGSDARLEQEEDSGRLADVTGPLAGARPSIVLLSIDALRPDHVGAYGYRRPTTPNLDAFARGAARFDHAYCASPRSLRSFASIWTGRYPSLVAWGNDNQFPPLEASNVTLAEVLRDGGWATAAFNNADYFHRTEGFYQGFAEFRQGNAFKDEVRPTVDAAAHWIRSASARDEPFFVWVHLMEPHDPYRDLAAPREFGHRPIDTYDEEIARADEAARTVFDAVDEVSSRRPVITVVIGDHGEAFGEHGYFHHSFDLHEEAIRVPLIVRGPGIAPGPRAALASLMDLHPTLLNYAGLRPAVPVSGRSLVPALQVPATPMVGRGWRDHLYAEVTPDGLIPFEQKALIAPPFKILWDVRRGTWELFDLQRDPREVRNLYDSHTETATELRRRLLTWVENAGVGRSRSADLIAAARLRAVPRMQNPIGVRFGNVVELLGYDIESRAVPVGGTVRMTFYYRVLGRTREPLWIGLWFQPTDGEPIWGHFQASHYPVYGRYPTTQWLPGEILRDEVTLRVESEMRPVTLRIQFAIEHEGRTNRVPPAVRALPDGALDVGELVITPPAP